MLHKMVSVNILNISNRSLAKYLLTEQPVLLLGFRFPTGGSSLINHHYISQPTLPTHLPARLYLIQVASQTFCGEIFII